MELSAMELSATEILRPLDSFEEHFWLMEKVTARSHALIVRISGAAGEEEWRAAFYAVQEHYPSLMVSIGKRPGERPFFYHVVGRKLPIDFRELDEDTSLESCAEAELLRSFGAGEGPLTRVTVFRGKEQSAVILCSHHAVVDGRAHLHLLRDALDLLAGGELRKTRQGFPAATSELLGRLSFPYMRWAELNEGDPPLKPVHAIAPIRVIRTLVRKTELEVMLKACRANGVSFHSALLVALANGMLRSKMYGASDGIRALTPVDIRKKLGVRDAVGMFFVLHRIVIERSTSFWAEANRLCESLKPHWIDEAATAFFNLAEYLVEEEHSPVSHIAKIAGTEFVHDLMVTNYGVLDIQRAGRFRIEDMFTAGIAGHLETQKISALTLNGNLHLTLVGQCPIPGLVDMAIEEILMASKGFV